MLSETITQFVDQFGYLAFFLAFSLGPFGIPVPNEVTMLTAGTMGDMGILNPWIIYICILSGLMTAVSIGYLIGKVFGKKITIMLENKKCYRYFLKVENLFQTYGDLAMCIGYFIPIVRYVVPVFVGMSGVRFKKFAYLSYTSSIVWTSLFFGMGKVFGNQFSQILIAIDLKIVGMTLGSILFIFLLSKLFRVISMKKEQKGILILDIEKKRIDA
jgi:membrane-associated protein